MRRVTPLPNSSREVIPLDITLAGRQRLPLTKGATWPVAEQDRANLVEFMAQSLTLTLKIPSLSAMTIPDPLQGAERTRLSELPKWVCGLRWLVGTLPQLLGT